MQEDLKCEVGARGAEVLCEEKARGGGMQGEVVCEGRWDEKGGGTGTQGKVDVERR